MQTATLWRISVELSRRRLGTRDVFHAFNASRNGLMSCGELGAGLAWLGLPVNEADLHALLRGIDADADGLLALEEWAAAFHDDAAESDASTQALLANLSLTPMRVKELYEGAQIGRRQPTPVPAAALAKFKFKLKAHGKWSCVWSNKSTGAHNDVSIWAPELEGGGGFHKKSHGRVCVGHLPIDGFDSPGKAKVEPIVLEVTDTAVQHKLTAASEYMGAVVDQLLPPPLRYRLAWHDAHAKPPLYIWRAVPPSHDYVAIGMIASTSEEQPELTAMSCVPRRWVQHYDYGDAPKCVWRHGGQVRFPDPSLTLP